MNKEGKKTLYKKIVPYVKAGKVTSKPCMSCFNQIKQIWNIVNYNRFSELYYLRNSEMFFCFETMVVLHTSTPSHCQKAIKKLNNIIIAQLTTNKNLNILNKTQRFDSFANQKILGKEFETWPTDPLSDVTFITVSIYLINLNYLKNGSCCFTEFSNRDTEESNKILVGLDKAIVIPKTDNQNLSDLIDLKAKQANKKKEKNKRRRQRKMNLV